MCQRGWRRKEERPPERAFRVHDLSSIARPGHVNVPERYRTSTELLSAPSVVLVGAAPESSREGSAEKGRGRVVAGVDEAGRGGGGLNVRREPRASTDAWDGTPSEG